ncbi:MAG TPA: ABC transporter ATP-binding protein [Tissierellia bacterium]|nr:ABC transporter ATP-binding protein [Tissierellia bacterium]
MLRRFASYYKPHKKLFFLDLLAALIVSAVDLIYPLFTQTIINDLIPNAEIRRMVVIALILLGLYFIRASANYFMLTYGHLVGGRIEYGMRRDLFSHLQTLDVSFFDRNKTGQLMSRLMSDLNEISELAHHGPEDIFISSVMLLGSFIILLRINVPLTLITFGLVSLLLVVTMLTRKNMRSASLNVRKVNAEMNARIENALSGVRLTKSFVNEQFEEELFDEVNTTHLGKRFQFFKAMGWFHAGTNLIVDVMSLVILVLGGYFVYLGQINVGDMVAYILYSTYFIAPIRRLINFTQQFLTGMTGFERMVEILEVRPEIDDRPGAIDLSEVEGLIEFDQVTFQYQRDGEDILQNFSLRIEPGRSVALVGPSGVGKTTISRLIPRFYDVASGAVKIDGIDIRDLSIRSIRRNVGMVDQDVFMFYGSIKDNILYGRLDASDEEVIAAAKKANIHDFIMEQTDGYNTIVGERGVRLSGGQKQRLAIARVFLKDPKILVLDEATSSLDNENEKIIQAALTELAKGRTTLTIAHRLSTIVAADEIVVLGDEGILERGPHSELLARDGLYARLYRAQFADLTEEELRGEDSATS